MGMAGKLGRGRRSNYDVNAGVGGFGGPPPGPWHPRLGGRGVIADADGMRAM
jgi:hypothetical protein